MSVLIVIGFGVVTANAEQYYYDSLGRVEMVVYDDVTGDKYSYDAVGNLLSVERISADDLSKIEDDNSKESISHNSNNSMGSNASTGDSGNSCSGKNNQTNSNDVGVNDNNQDRQTVSSSDSNQTQPVSADSTTEDTSDNQVSDEDLSDNSDVPTESDDSLVLRGQKHTVGYLIYKIKSVSSKNDKGTVSVVGVKKSKRKKRSYTIPKTVKIKGHKYKVVSIGKKAFSKCKKCRTINIKSKTITSIHKTAFKGSRKRLKIKVPRKQYKKYKKLLKKCKGYKCMRIV
jgi:hypothetical protein